jgi:VWFA-related protein
MASGSQDSSAGQSKTPPTLNDRSKLPPSQNSGQSSLPPQSNPEDEEIRIETNLVSLPVTVLDRDGRFISGLQKTDFQLFENGKEQKIEYFQSLEQPITVALLLDVSPSTRFRIEEIQDAAIDFVNQLKPSDKVIVIAFDEDVRVLTPPTSNRSQIISAIRRTNFGDGTSLYEAVDYALSRALSQFEGRKAVVIFTDGVDTTSKKSSFETTLAESDESTAAIYPIRFNTQRDAWAGGQPPSSRRRTSVGWGGIIGIILGGGIPPFGGNAPIGSSPEEYERGRKYLSELALRSGGRMFEADTTRDLSLAFSGVAEELRRQYFIGYYPDSSGKPGERRQIRVRVLRPNVVVRTKSSYVIGENTLANK